MKHASRLSLYFADKKGKFKKFFADCKKIAIQPNYRTGSRYKSRKQKKDEIESISINENGCQQYIEGQYQDALVFFSAAKVLWPTNDYYMNNRVACLMAMNKYQLAAAEATKAVKILPTFTKAYLRGISFTILGEVEQAAALIDQLRDKIGGSFCGNRSMNLDEILVLHRSCKEVSLFEKMSLGNCSIIRRLKLRRVLEVQAIRCDLKILGLRAPRVTALQKILGLRAPRSPALQAKSWAPCTTPSTAPHRTKWLA